MMATHQQELAREIREHNQCLDAALRRRSGGRVCLRSYKIFKAGAQLAGTAAGIYAMWLGADPMTAFAIIGAIIVGPEAVETALTNGDGGSE